MTPQARRGARRFGPVVLVLVVLLLVLFAAARIMAPLRHAPRAPATGGASPAETARGPGSTDATSLAAAFVAALQAHDGAVLTALFAGGEAVAPAQRAAALQVRYRSTTIVSYSFDPAEAKGLTWRGERVYWLYLRTTEDERGLLSVQTLLVPVRTIGGRWYASTVDESTEGLSGVARTKLP